MAISSDIKLAVFNGALRHLAARKLASLSENRESRRVLDDIWDNSRLVVEALEKADWNFALRSVMLEYDPSIETEFGFQRVFRKPDDFLRLSALSGDEYFTSPLTSRTYADEGLFWLSDHETIYVRYVSDGDTYGLDASRWSAAFRTYLEAALAFEAAPRLTNSRSKIADMDSIMRRVLVDAKSLDAINDGPKFPPRGSWIRSRSGGSKASWGRER